MGQEGEEAIVSCGTTKGPIVMHMHHDWSPHGYDRVVDLFERGFYDHSHFFRAVPKFLVQFGITYSDDPELRKLMHQKIPDDPQLDPPIPFDVGIMSFAGGGANTRTSQIFISYGKSKALGTNPWETPFGQVIEGMENAQQFYSYGDMPPWGKGPKQGQIYSGPDYINDNFPLIDKFETCTVKRINSAGGRGSDDYGADNRGAEHEQIAKNTAADAVREPAKVKVAENIRSKLLRNPVASMENLDIPENSLVLAGVALVVVFALVAAIRGSRKNESKTQ